MFTLKENALEINGFLVWCKRYEIDNQTQTLKQEDIYPRVHTNLITPSQRQDFEFPLIIVRQYNGEGDRADKQENNNRVRYRPDGFARTSNRQNDLGKFRSANAVQQKPKPA